MPLDVRGCTRVTLTCSTSITISPGPTGFRQSVNARRDGDCALKLSHINEEFLVRVGHQPALITSLSFVHTARRFYRSNCSMRIRDEGVSSVERPGRLFGTYSNLVI